VEARGERTLLSGSGLPIMVSARDLPDDTDKKLGEKHGGGTDLAELPRLVGSFVPLFFVDATGPSATQSRKSSDILDDLLLPAQGTVPGVEGDGPERTTKTPAPGRKEVSRAPAALTDEEDRFWKEADDGKSDWEHAVLLALTLVYGGSRLPPGITPDEHRRTARTVWNFTDPRAS